MLNLQRKLHLMLFYTHKYVKVHIIFCYLGREGGGLGDNP